MVQEKIGLQEKIKQKNQLTEQEQEQVKLDYQSILNLINADLLI